MKLLQIFRFGTVTGLSVLSLAACAHPGPPSTSPSSPSPGSTHSRSTGGTGPASSSPGFTVSPPIEGTGLESPQSPGRGGGGDGVAISVAPLPTGKEGDSGDNDECIQISWLGQPIPGGDVVTVTAVIVQSPFTFDKQVTAGCADGPSCAGYQFSAANDNGEFCNVGVGYIGGVIDADNGVSTDGSMRLAGQLSCPDAGSAACRHDAAVMQGSGNPSISFEVGVDLPGSPGSGSSPPVNSGSSPPAAVPGSSPPTSGSSSPAVQGSP